MPNMAYDPARNLIVLAWQAAEQQLHPVRFSGPVYLMTGNPEVQRPKPITFSAIHTNLAAFVVNTARRAVNDAARIFGKNTQTPSDIIAFLKALQQPIE